MQTVYRTVNLTNQKFYIGVHETNDSNDDYLGSGVVLEADIKELGRASFQKTVLFSFGARKDAYEKEMELIEIARENPLCYNIHGGGRGGNTRAYHKVKRFGAANPMFGRRWTAEEKKAIGERSRIMHRNMTLKTKLESRRKSSQAQKGKPRKQSSVDRMKETKLKNLGKHRFTMYELRDPNGQSYVITGHRNLAAFCKDHKLSIWSVDWILLENQEPSHGRCVGWTAKIIGHVRQKSPSAPQYSQVLSGGPSFGQVGEWSTVPRTG
jgi:hypothetical protein